MSIGLYIHIPFCLSKCAYCDFTSYPGRVDLIPAYVEAVLAEARLYRNLLAREEVASLYLGGGTPSLLPPEELTKILGLLSSCRLAEPVEVTMEANPGTIDQAKIEAFLAAGGNRLSLGLQTHDPMLLELLGRRHTTAEAADAARLARALGVNQISLDLIYGLPGQTVACWEETLSYALSLAPDHLSVYSLELHPGTPLAARVTAEQAVLPDEEEAAAMLEQAMTVLPEAGLRQYEIANFARPGAECRHNLNYWRNGSYLGLGAAAHSHLTGKRRANLADLDRYLTAVDARQVPVAFTEEISPSEDLVETLLLGLRLREGIALDLFPRRFGHTVETLFGAALTGLVGEHLVALDGERLRLTDSGVVLADYVLRTLVCI